MRTERPRKAGDAGRFRRCRSSLCGGVRLPATWASTLVAVLCWVVLAAAPVRAETDVVTLASLDWAPYAGETLPGGGFTTEIVREAFRRAGYRVEITYMPWIRVLAEVENGTFDAMSPAYYSDRRAEVYALSEPIASGPLVLCKRTDRSLRYRTLEDLWPYRIGVVRGYVNTPEFDAAEDLDKRIVNSDKQNLLKVLTGRIDLAVIDMYTAQRLIRTAIPQAVDKLEFMTPPLEIKTLHVGFSRKHPAHRERLEAFDRALARMKREGVVQRILADRGLRAYPETGMEGPVNRIDPGQSTRP